MQLHFRDHSLADMTRQAVQANEAAARRQGVSIALGEIDPGIVVYVDAGRYQQVLSNLLSNAAKYSPAGGVVEVGAELHGDWVRMFVRDRGEGIPEDFRARIFGRFSQADPPAARRKGGAGLGLYISRQLVEQMRGNIGFVTEVGAGTTFWVEFPRVTRDHRRQAIF